MTSMSVEYQELMARADLLDQPMPKLPEIAPQPPCPFPFVEATAGRLDWNATEMRKCLEDGEREWKNLATSLRNAAMAYETVDEGSAAALGSVSADSSGGSSVGGNVNAVSVTPASRETAGIASTESAGALADPSESEYPNYDVREAAYIIKEGDQGTSYNAFAYEWYAFERALLEETDRFTPFLSWQGKAKEAVEANFAQQVNWIHNMAGLCVDLAKQARQVVDAHEKAVVYEKWGTYDEEAGISHTVPAEHPTTYEVSQTDFWYAEYTRRDDAQGVATTIEWYEEMQLQSETSLKLYVSNGRMPIPALRPSYAPNAYPISEPPPTPAPGESDNPDLSDRPGGGINIPAGNYPGQDGGYSDYPTDGSQTDGSLTDGSLSDAGLSSGGGMAGMGGMPSSQGNSELADAAKRNAPGGVKPAAAMGGGGGAGGGGMPKMPLADAAGAEGAAGGAGAAGGRAGIGGAVAGVGGRGGMAGGGMPMGGGSGAGQGKDGKQGKRVASEEEALYTEDREWTGGVIGRRRSKGVGDD